MKTTLKAVSLSAIVAFATFSFTTTKEKKTVNVETSTVQWKGYKVTGSHYGTINLKSGALIFDGETLTGGTFEIDMNTINTQDLEGSYKDKLDAHLKSDDFFGVAKYPTATLVFTNVEATGKNAYEVTGDLTIKGNTNAVTFDLSVYGSKATANVKIDRSKYDVRYGSTSFFDGLKDKAIYDEFDLVVDLEF
ncbi:MAG TPA: YceI family protein [Flavobacteriaceae bacterium]|nr:YceI family protein [Flavobacteriaceae bacterium]